MKPWARIEIGYLSHPKFLALNANAICLWHEGKNYCDAHQTDGRIPKDALKMFRFRGAKSVSQLLTSCGDKPNGTPYAPLWETDADDYVMHDYLAHNDCRDEVLARMEQADESRAVDRERLKRWRASKKNKHVETRFTETEKRVSETLSTETPTETPTETETKERSERAAPFHRALGPRVGLLKAPRPEAAFDGGRVWVLHKTHKDFMALRNGNERELRAWYAEVAESWNRGAHAHDEPGPNMFKFWDARYAEKWPATGGLTGLVSAKVSDPMEAWLRAKAAKA